MGLLGNLFGKKQPSAAVNEIVDEASGSTRLHLACSSGNVEEVGGANLLALPGLLPAPRLEPVHQGEQPLVEPTPPVAQLRRQLRRQRCGLRCLSDRFFGRAAI